MYNYIGLINKPSAVSITTTACFLNKNTKNLILAKGNIIEIYNIKREGLESTPYINLYGNIDTLLTITNDSNKPDSLFVATADCSYCVLSYNEHTKQITTIISGSFKEDIGKKHHKTFYSLATNHEFILISAYSNIFRVIFLRPTTTTSTTSLNNSTPSSQQLKDFSFRYDYDDLLTVIPINPSSDFKDDSQIFGIIKSSTKHRLNDNTIDDKFVLFETISYNPKKNKQEFSKEQNWCFDLTKDPTVTLSFSPMFGGLVLFNLNSVRYYPYYNFKPSKEKFFSNRKMKHYCMINHNRYFVVDDECIMHLLAFRGVTSDLSELEMIFQPLGDIANSASITYLDNNYLFNASMTANSQLIKVNRNFASNSNTLLEVVEEYESLAPINDFLVFSDSKANEGHLEILCASGEEKAGSFKCLTKGSSVIVDKELEIKGVNDVFCVDLMPDMFDDNFDDLDDSNNVMSGVNLDKLLILGLVDKTVFLKLKVNENIFEFIGKDDLVTKNVIIMNKENFIRVCEREILIYNTSNNNTFSNIGEKMFNGMNLKIINSIKFNDNILIAKNNEQFLFMYHNDLTLRKIPLTNLVPSNNNNSSNLISAEYSQVILENHNLSNFFVSQKFLIFDDFLNNSVNILTLWNNKIEQLLSFPNEDIAIISIEFLKDEGNIYYFLSTNIGTIYVFKFKCKILFV